MSIWPGVGRKSVVVVVVDATGTMSFLSVLSLPRCARAVHLDECRVAGLRRRCAAADGLWCTGGRVGEWLGALWREIPHSLVRSGIHT